MNKDTVKKGENINWIAAGAFICGLYVLLGAFGAHGLKEHLKQADLNTYHTALRYLSFHGIALIAVNITAIVLSLKLRYVNYLFTAGILLFSGSLLLHSTKSLLGFDMDFFAMLAPIGGLSFVIAWIMLAIKLLRKK
ncbi:MAG: DUF423 domain-containing protein [Bacteroidia bacterium]